MKRKIKGTVVSDKMDKTIAVLVETTKTHPLYRKKYTVSQKFLAHDEANKYKVGDVVEIEESNPKSKRKKWQVTNNGEKK